jgi:hypothetical protein
MGMKTAEWNIFHELIVLDELSAASSLLGALFGGQAFAIPPLVKYGKDWMKKELVPALYAGKTTAALAISEPHAGSDVQNITTSAKLTDDGKHWIVNGEKKWVFAFRALPKDDAYSLFHSQVDHRRCLGRLVHHGRSDWRTRRRWYLRHDDSEVQVGQDPAHRDPGR